MKWKRIPKDRVEQPASGTYKSWKERLALEADYQCVYCAIHESHFGGFRNFHVEHFRPKSRFTDLTNDYCNVFYACAICNVFKGSDWPSEPSSEVPSYLDPSIVDYSTVFTVDWQTGLTVATAVAAAYMLEKLFLNRPQLVLLRRLVSLKLRAQKAVGDLSDVLRHSTEQRSAEARQAALELSAKIITHLIALDAVRPYSEDDVERGS